MQTTYRKLVSVADIGKEQRTKELKAFLSSPKPTPAAALVETWLDEIMNSIMTHNWRRRQTALSLFSISYLSNITVKLARLDEGEKYVKKTGEAIAETFIFQQFVSTKAKNEDP